MVDSTKRNAAEQLIYEARSASRRVRRLTSERDRWLNLATACRQIEVSMLRCAATRFKRRAQECERRRLIGARRADELQAAVDDAAGDEALSAELLLVDKLRFGSRDDAKRVKSATLTHEREIKRERQARYKKRNPLPSLDDPQLVEEPTAIIAREVASLITEREQLVAERAERSARAMLRTVNADLAALGFMV